MPAPRSVPPKGGPKGKKLKLQRQRNLLLKHGQPNALPPPPQPAASARTTLAPETTAASAQTLLAPQTSAASSRIPPAPQTSAASPSVPRAAPALWTDENKLDIGRLKLSNRLETLWKRVDELEDALLEFGSERRLTAALKKQLDQSQEGNEILRHGYNNIKPELDASTSAKPSPQPEDEDTQARADFAKEKAMMEAEKLQLEKQRKRDCKKSRVEGLMEGILEGTVTETLRNAREQGTLPAEHAEQAKFLDDDDDPKAPANRGMAIGRFVPHIMLSPVNTEDRTGMRG
ncbi:hypothetical protein BDV96DRAFT_654521 [Lophiotrema nucula]|uniref:Uncharacterized protein n=1 Tax=Lophiotrema nucula TaxID=690887 RepID=A0A6A5YKK7_9PLEO|nr:hypothetical protein BDV96DRAFT_654521 [Lophiotrema nucula]